ncbi:uncharacterized protein SPPG_09278 [Spizellomyces punctatus DAOM BR117]|uniref:Uncharacterized protein n=1 Tax=Spizellomyces punctatus (strain DAOM BR117) TaxID=645134 RepID=A0A0L0HDZ9_SPIPD|nr:uncharacterized protein SPPG_09278 [Spizellomyces punctatus DAOM BR117]KNC99199.1 hypothetical protein SPPG_09278 [Spizellomyces punctatus DAOM BR117]|eukprot:XP_016607239.1 hypothetical protein SPPG_09278 [Spizellomyces punctatus DAOM BR117]
MDKVKATHTGTRGHERYFFNPADPETVSRAVSEFVADSATFISAIDWTEPFIAVLISFHVLLALWVVLTRNNQTLTASNFVAIGVLALAAQPLNYLASQHWATFSRTNYFDAQGVFMSIMWAGPLMIELIFCVIMLVRQAGDMVVKVKREQLKRKPTAKSKASKKDQ